MRFLVDAQLPPALARWLSAAGFEAEHVADVGLASANDAAIWAYAVQSQAILISKDEDFAQRKISKDGGPIVVWVRLRNTRRRQLLIWFEGVLPAILENVARGETFIEMR